MPQTLQDQAWLQADDVKALFAAFPDESLRCVGGCVRNSLLGESVDDIDLATTLSPTEVQAVLDAAKIHHVPTGFDHGTITAVISGAPFEITSLRKDVSTDGRRAVVEFTTDWAEDAARRDFTINALYADLDGQIYDPLGSGLEDIKARRLRFIGQADDRIEEDFLRILRYFRFAAWYVPDAPFDKTALEACRRGRAGLKKLSAERVWKEIKKLLSAPSPSRVLRVMLTHDVLETLLPEASNVEGLELLCELETREKLTPDPLLRLMVMSTREPLPMALLCTRLKMSKAETSRLRAWSDDATPLDPFADERTKLAAIYKAGNQVVKDRALLRAAGETDARKYTAWMDLVRLTETWTAPKFPISGKDLKAAGIKQGPQMGKVMDALNALWVRSGFQADRQKLLMALKLLGH